MTSDILRRFRRSRTALAGCLLVAAGVVVYGIVSYSHHGPPIPTYQVARGEFLDVLQFRGELKAMKSVTISAPSDVGNLQILKIVSNGTQVKQGDLVVQFDPSKSKEDLAQDSTALKSSQAEIDEARADAMLTEEKDTTAVMKARYDVEAASLDASKEEIVSQIEGAEANLKLTDAKQSLREAEDELASDKMTDRATIEGKANASRKAAYDVQQAKHTLDSTTLLAPSSGAIRLIPVWHETGESPFKDGESVWPGAPIAQLPDSSSLRVTARVDETERGRLETNAPITAQVDAITDHPFTGKIEKISTIASPDFSAGWPIVRNFDLQISLDQSDPRLRPGMTAQVTVIVNRIPNAISIPVQASFLRSGQTVVYVWDGSKFKPRVIEVGGKSRDRVLVSSGLRAGELIALSDPSSMEH